MAEIPRAHPLPQVGTIQPLGVGAGLATGLHQGAQMGYMGAQARHLGVADQVAQQKVQQEQQILEEEKKKNEVTQSLQKFGHVAKLYTDTHKKYRPGIWPILAAKANELLGTKFDPNMMPEGADDDVAAFQQEIKLLFNKEQSFGDTMKKLGMIRVRMEEEEGKAADASRDFLMSTTEGAKIKSQGAGTFTLQGYDPNTKDQLFTNSKAPGVFNAQGVPFSGPLQSKTDLDRTQTEIRKVDNIMGSVGELETLLDQIPPGATGGLESLATKVPGGGLIFKQASQYEDQLPSYALTFYRASTGDTGNSSDKDARARALPFMPRLRDPSETRVKKLRVIKSMLNRRKEGLSHGVFEIPFDPAGSSVGGSAKTKTIGKDTYVSEDGGKTWFKK